MKPFCAAAALALIAVPAMAADEWKEEAISEIRTLQDVEEALWSENGALWLSTLRTDQQLPVYTEIAVCAQMTFAGKPQGERVLVRWFSAPEMTQDKMVRVATAWCP